MQLEWLFLFVCRGRVELSIKFTKLSVKFTKLSISLPRLSVNFGKLSVIFTFLSSFQDLRPVCFQMKICARDITYGLTIKSHAKGLTFNSGNECHNHTEQGWGDLFEGLKQQGKSPLQYFNGIAQLKKAMPTRAGMAYICSSFQFVLFYYMRWFLC